MTGELTDNRNLAPSKDGWIGLLFKALLVFGIAMLSRIALVNHAPIYDELYQILPAISFHQNGTLAVLDGIYDRGSMFTKLVAYCFNLAPEYTMSMARLIPSVLPGALLIAVIFVWTARVSGEVAAFIAVAFLILWPNGIEVSQYVRFYALQGLVFVSAALLVYTAVRAQISSLLRLICILLALALLYFALKLQILTALSASAVGVWVALFIGPVWLRNMPRLWWGVAALVACIAAILISGIFEDEIAWAWTTYNWEPWPAQNDTTFYHRDFRDNYATFWPLFPLIAIVALRANFWPASFCITVFTTAFLLQSFGGLKNIRYLYSTMPFFFVVWGIGLQAVFPKLWAGLKDSFTQLLPDSFPTGLRNGLGFASIGIGLVFLLGANSAVPRSAKLIAGIDGNQLLGKTRWQWTTATEMMQPWLEKRALIVTSEEMRVIQNIGDFDLAFNKPRFSEMLYSMGPNTQPYTKDFRSGRPLIGSLEDMKQVMACIPVGVFVMDAPGVGSANSLALIAYAYDVDLKITLDERVGMSLLGWEHTEGALPAASCDDLYDFGTDRAADRVLDGRSKPKPIAYKASADK